MDTIFTPNKFKPGPLFQDILYIADQNEFGDMAPQCAAGFLAYYCSGENFEDFVDALVDNGLTRKGLCKLTAACVRNLGEF